MDNLNNLYTLYSLDDDDCAHYLHIVGSLEQCIRVYDYVLNSEKVICPYSLGETVIDLLKYKYHELGVPIIYKRGHYFWKVGGESESMERLSEIEGVCFWKNIEKVKYGSKETIFSGVCYCSEETANIIKNTHGINYFHQLGPW